MKKIVALGLLLVFIGTILVGCTPATYEDVRTSGTGYCPPGTLKVISGQWYSCGGGNWMLVQDPQLRTYTGEEMTMNLKNGKVANFLAVGTVLALDPVPLNEIGYFVIGGVVFIVIFAVDALPQANFIGTDAESFQRWHQGSSVTVDVAVVNAYIDPKLGDLRFTSDTPHTNLAPVGTTGIIVEDDYFSALLLGNALLAAGITPVAVYTDCDSYSRGPIKTAHVIVVDTNSEFTGTKGWICVEEMYRQVPPPILVIAYTGGPNSSVISNFVSKGAQQVVDKYTTTQNQLTELIVRLLVP